MKGPRFWKHAKTDLSLTRVSASKRIAAATLSCISALLLSFLIVGSTLGIFVKDASSGGSYGEVGLRSYFERGLGTQELPYVITRPRHLFNLSHLQALGVFGEKCYFKLGLENLGGVDSGGVPMCYVGDTDEKKPYLDMTGSEEGNNRIFAIGSESVPFYGEFDGQNVEIKNLHVYANPQDAGLFGYTAHGSVVKNLFLDSTTIHTFGYENADERLYGDGGVTLQEAVKFVHYPGGVVGEGKTHTDLTYADPVDGYVTFDGIDFYETYAEDEEDLIPVPDPLPCFTAIPLSSSDYQCKTLLSGVLLRIREDGAIEPNWSEVFTHFQEQIAKADDEEIPDSERPHYPLETTSSASIVCGYMDSDGYTHSKVLLTLDCRFTLDHHNPLNPETPDVHATDSISMEFSVSGDHGNNIGLFIGHCDGSISDCYAHDGAFDMNEGNGDDYHYLANGSDFGLIGKIGNTVYRAIDDENGSASSEGKSIGAVDFSTIYKAVSPTDFTSLSGGDYYSYAPGQNNFYSDYLCYETTDGERTYYTKDDQSIAFHGQTVIKSTSLGVFTIVTDHGVPGIDGTVYLGLDKTLIHKDATPTSTLYYTTGEFAKDNPSLRSGESFRTYRNSLLTDAPRYSLLGHHLPAASENSAESFQTRELRQSYYFRFDLSPSQRRNSRNALYFADIDRGLDTHSQGGSFLSNYFHYKLVDESGLPFNYDSDKAGVYIRNSSGHEIDALSASFDTRDRSHNDRKEDKPYWPELATVQDEEGAYFAENMVNFEISTDYANVTVIAASMDPSKPSAVGIYEMDDTHLVDSVSYGVPYKYVDKDYMDYDDPEYAFVLPDEDHLAFFDYDYDTTLRRGKIGLRTGESAFTEAIPGVEAHLPEDSPYGYDSSAERLFAHVFTLPRGRYCIGSASGARDPSISGMTTAKIYYVAAQGQTEGEQQFTGNVYAGGDIVERCDFLKLGRYDASTGTKVISVAADLDDPTTYDMSASGSLENSRCFIGLRPKSRSSFTATTDTITFTYDADDGFLVDSTSASALVRIALNNYGDYFKTRYPALSETDIANLYVSILSGDSVLLRTAEDEVTYTYVSP